VDILKKAMRRGQKDAARGPKLRQNGEKQHSGVEKNGPKRERRTSKKRDGLGDVKGYLRPIEWKWPRKKHSAGKGGVGTGKREGEDETKGEKKGKGLSRTNSLLPCQGKDLSVRVKLKKGGQRG